MQAFASPPAPSLKAAKSFTPSWSWQARPPVISQKPALLMPMKEWQASTCCATSGLVGAMNTTLPCGSRAGRCAGLSNGE